MSRVRCGLSLFLGGCASAIAIGEGITPISQTRSVTAIAGNVVQQISAADFSDFNDAADAGLSNEFAVVNSSSTQVSSISKDKIAAFGTADTLGYGDNGSAESLVTIVFSLATPVDFSLTGSANFQATGVTAETTRLIRLTGPDTSIEFALYNDTQASMPIASSGQLAPGTYTLEVVGSAAAEPISDDPEAQNGAYVDFEISLSVVAIPEPSAALMLGAGLSLLRRRR
ncbi:MAG: PEP-CTERM sorting domain-containing protein [Phycisphaerales bacterium]|nr:PEP-CTERM sorting domain-containing protein [Phycisphaerales bacterium]